jgi:K+-transporting ATPase ATPase C chain
MPVVKELGIAIRLLLVMTVVTGAIYPGIVTGIAKIAWPFEAGGSLIERDGKVIGSELIGQPFDAPRYFWSRASATSPAAYNAGASSGSNQGPLNPALTDAVNTRLKALREADPEQRDAVPVDLVTASASGLDPHISPAAAALQVHRVANARGISEDAVRTLIAQHTEQRTFGVLGEPRVNVLLLNLDLDRARAEAMN